MHGDLWLFCGLHIKILQSDKFGEKMTAVLVLCPIFVVPSKFMFIFHLIKVAVIQKEYSDPIFLRCQVNN